MSDNERPGVSNPPHKMSERTLRTTLERIESTIEEQKTIEAERAGAAKLRTRILTAFGGVITAAAVAGFAWVWDAQTTNALQDVAIEQLARDARTHDPTPPGHEELGELETHDVALDRRVDAAENASKAINVRLDNMEKQSKTRHDAVLLELRRIRTRRPTWGD